MSHASVPTASRTDTETTTRRTEQAAICERIESAFEAAARRYGSFGFEPCRFSEHVLHLSEKYVSRGSSAFLPFVESLHLFDLYLALGCVRRHAAAWVRFSEQYRDYITKLAAAVALPLDPPQDLSDAVIADLYLPDRSGRSRIGLYDGRSSLYTWLRVIVCRRALNERKRKAGPLQRLLPHDTVDDSSLDTAEVHLRARRYGHLMLSSVEDACRRLSSRERGMLLLRYEEGLKISEIARRFRVHPSNVTRQIDRVCQRMKILVARTLADKHRLSAAAVQECMADAVDYVYFSILPFIRDAEIGTPPSSRRPVSLWTETVHAKLNSFSGRGCD
jgi:RNA polymerase sigma-70 factor, ECF subfamily